MIETKLGKISAVLKTGKTPPSKKEEYFENDFNWYTPADITNTKYINTSERHISNLAIKDRKAFLYPEKSILITCIGNIGRVGISNERCSSNQQITAIKPIDKVDVEYLYYWFHLNQSILIAKSNSAVVPILNNRTLKEVTFKYPPLETQKHIASILDDAAALRDKTAKLLEEYDQLAQSIFLEMFGDPVTNSKDFKKVPINKLGKIITGSTPSSKKENMFGGEIPFITPSDLDSNEEFKRKVTKQGAENSRIVNKNALLICCIGATIGKRRMADKKSAFNQQINAIEWSNKIDPKFGYWVFNWVKYEVIQRAISTTLPIMKKSEFEKIKCPVPPIELQTQFAEKIGLIEQQKVLVKEELQESEDLFQCLLQKAFKGELV